MATEGNICTREEENQALVEASRLTTWKDIHKSYIRFRHCDDGAIAEGYDQSIAKILSSSSTKLDELHTFTRADVEFENFIIRHVSGAVPIDELKKIKCNLSLNCPKEAKDLCEKLIKAANLVE
jgi:hypothetical protein